MDIDATLQTLLNDLGQHMGLSELTLDEEGFTALRFDADLVINLQYVVDSEALLLYADLGPAASGAALYPTLLRANLFWRATLGATLSLSGTEPPHVILAQEFPWQQLRMEELATRLESFVNTVEDWQAVIHDATGDTDALSLPIMPPPGMLRV